MRLDSLSRYPVKEENQIQHIPTDEVYGDLENDVDLFTENTYVCSIPASKASLTILLGHGVEHSIFQKLLQIVQIIMTISFSWKLTPNIILNALHGKPLPIYGKGDQIRDCIYVEDHAKALLKLLLKAS